MQQGFSLIKIMLFVGMAAAAVIAMSKVLPVYNLSWKIQESMDTVVRFYDGDGEVAAKKHLSELFDFKVINDGSVPKEFYDNLIIIADTRDPVVELSSEYTVVVWLLGELEGIEDIKDYDASELQGMNIARDKARLDLTFKPSASTSSL